MICDNVAKWIWTQTLLRDSCHFGMMPHWISSKRDFSELSKYFIFLLHQKLYVMERVNDCKMRLWGNVLYGLLPGLHIIYRRVRTNRDQMKKTKHHFFLEVLSSMCYMPQTSIINDGSRKGCKLNSKGKHWYSKLEYPFWREIYSLSVLEFFPL